MITNLDPHQIVQYAFDEKNRANRVVLVGGDKITVNADFSGLEGKIDELSNNLKLIENKPLIQEQAEIKIVEVPKIEFIKQIEYKEIEKPIIVKEVEYKEVKIPEYCDRIVYKEIEKPVYIEKQADFPIWLKVCLAIQTLAIILIAVKH